MEDSGDIQQFKEKQKQEGIEERYPYDCFAVTKSIMH